ncbi:EAL domain-containing protein [Salinispirillum sp. LH 10-3-1]|uniref:EAL domain-containing protein n=1 Tax=Salinispirillum sp. LH 10-3-1 TaxID=2952525 RepID=A0AB38YD21_9GAMM
MANSRTPNMRSLSLQDEAQYRSFFDEVRQSKALRRVLIFLAVLGLVTFVPAWLGLTTPALPVSTYLPLHTALEFSAIAIAVIIFTVGWSQTSVAPTLRLVVVATAFFAVALLDFSHTMSYAGMPDYFTPNSAEKAINFWLAARMVLAVALLLIVLPFSDRVVRQGAFFTVLGLSFLYIVSMHVWFLVFPSTVPRTFIQEQGLTPFKVSVEYLVIVLHLCAACLVTVRYHSLRGFQPALLFGALVQLAFSEFFFTLYGNPYDLYNLMGHVLKITGYAFLFRSFFYEAVTEPYRQLMRSQRQLKDSLADQHLSAIAFHTREAIMITDAGHQIVRVNAAFTDITGYTEKEVLGCNPKILSSGKHDETFYRELWRCIQTFGTWSGEIWNKRKNGEVFAEHAVINAVYDPVGEITHYIASFSDVTDRVQAQEQVHRLAFYDPLTGLANRRLMIEHILTAQADAERLGNYSALLFMDLDFFKKLNDTLGHSKGDSLLQQFAGRLKSHLRSTDTLARQGGDEFILLVRNLGTDKATAALHIEQLGEKILETVRQPFQLGQQTYGITVSVGAMIFGKEHHTVDDLLSSADLAMYQSKEQGRNRLHFFEPEMQEHLTKRTALEFDLSVALTKENELELFFQPKVDTLGVVQGYEALIRWNHPEQGLLQPGDFIELSESTGQIVALGRWVVQQVVSMQLHNLTTGMRMVPIAINVSPREFLEPDYADWLIEQLASTSVDPRWIELEITESALQGNLSIVQERLESLHRAGFLIAMDDFGTGYSSLSYLQHLPLSVLKIDQSFVAHVVDRASDRAIVKAIIALAKALDMKVVAEGVEDSAQSSELVRQGCDLFQGFFWSKPVPWAEAARLAEQPPR